VGCSRLLILVCVAFVCNGQAEDPREIIRKSVRVDNDVNRRAQDYTMVQKSVETVLDASGKIKSTSSKTRDVLFIRGERYTRLIERDGKALSPGEQKTEEEKLRKRTAERAAESEADYNKRLAAQEAHRQKQREFLSELPEAFDYKLLGEDKIDGRAVWIIEANPRPGYKPRVSKAQLFQKFRGKLWIDKVDYEWVKVECESIDTVSFGFFLARLGKGARLTFEQVRLNNEVWLPKRIQIRYDARLALLKHQVGELEQTMYNFRKFQTDSRILSVTEHTAP
jgi:hypothetical protein